MELSKSDKKIARMIMDKGIQKEFEICNTTILEILTDWKDNKKDNGKTYSQVYEMVKKNDKYLASNYNGTTGSHYFAVVLNIYCNGLVDEEDINQFSETTRQKLLFIKESRR